MEFNTSCKLSLRKTILWEISDHVSVKITMIIKHQMMSAEFAQRVLMVTPMFSLHGRKNVFRVIPVKWNSRT